VTGGGPRRRPGGGSAAPPLDGLPAGPSERPDAATSVYLPPWRVDVTRRPGVERLLAATALARLVATTLHEAGAPAPASIGVILSDDAELAALNRSAMGHPGPTDVLSFPLLPPAAYPAHPGGPAGPGDGADRDRGAGHGRGGDPASVPAFALPPGQRPHLGDVVVSVERAAEQARDGRGGQAGASRWSPRDELRLLAVHGVLHVCGWDHARIAERDAMRALENRILGDAARAGGTPVGPAWTGRAEAAPGQPPGAPGRER